MQKCGFSETQFSFCFTFEYLQRFLPVIPLPIFPNTVVEGKAGGGYDVRINGSFFFQFKIPKFYDIENNFTRQKWNCVGGQPYYSIKLNTDSEQFRLLKALKRPTNKVYYVTPEYHRAKQIGSYYNANKIVTNSAMFDIGDFPNHGSGYHHLVYNEKASLGYLFSEPMMVPKSPILHPLEAFQQSPDDLTIVDAAREIASILRREDFTQIKPANSNQHPATFVKAVYAMLLTEYDIHWYPVIKV
jgi:hypothetical protein